MVRPDVELVGQRIGNEALRSRISWGSATGDVLFLALSCVPIRPCQKKRTEAEFDGERLTLVSRNYVHQRADAR